MSGGLIAVAGVVGANGGSVTVDDNGNILLSPLQGESVLLDQQNAVASDLFDISYNGLDDAVSIITGSGTGTTPSGVQNGSTALYIKSFQTNDETVRIDKVNPSITSGLGTFTINYYNPNGAAGGRNNYVFTINNLLDQGNGDFALWELINNGVIQIGLHGAPQDIAIGRESPGTLEIFSNDSITPDNVQLDIIHNAYKYATTALPTDLVTTLAANMIASGIQLWGSIGASAAINSTSNGSPTLITTSTPHGLAVGDLAYLVSAPPNTTLNNALSFPYVARVLTTPSSTTLTVTGVNSTGGGAGGSVALGGLRTSAETNRRWIVKVDGAQNWGAGGSQAIDLQLVRNGGTRSTIAITGSTAANPTTVTSAAHGLQVGSLIYVTGSSTIPTGTYVVLTAPSATTFTIAALGGSADGTFEHDFGGGIGFILSATAGVNRNGTGTPGQGPTNGFLFQPGAYTLVNVEQRNLFVGNPSGTTTTWIMAGPTAVSTQRINYFQQMTLDADTTAKTGSVLSFFDLEGVTFAGSHPTNVRYNTINVLRIGKNATLSDTGGTFQYNPIKIDDHTITHVGAANTLPGYSMINLGALTISASSGTKVEASTLYIKAAPVITGGGTLTNGYSIHVAAGTTKLDGDLLHAGTNVGFYGVAGIARQLLATGAAHTVDDVITVLQSLGLLRQS